jgi:hypothetical protein
MMTTQEAKSLKPGQYVDYLGTKAMVRGVRKNGVIVEFWGNGLQEDKYIVRRVSATYLKAL